MWDTITCFYRVTHPDTMSQEIQDQHCKLWSLSETKRAVSWLARLVTGVSWRKAGFDLRLIHVGPTDKTVFSMPYQYYSTCIPYITDAIYFFPHMALQPNAGYGLLIHDVFRDHTSDAPQSVGLLWTSDQSGAETSTWQHTTLTTDKHPCPRRDSNPQSQQASGRRPTP
jgi:hypothetical protein